MTGPCSVPLACDQDRPAGQSRLSDSRQRHCARCAGQVWRVAAKELGDHLRSGWVIACVLAWLGITGLTSFLGLLQIGRIGAQGYERTVLTLLSLVQYVVPLLGLLLGYDLVVREREEQTLRLLVAVGVNRAQVLLGKFLGGCMALAVALALGFAVAGAGIGLAARDHAIAPYLKLAGSGLGLGILFLSLGLMISTFSRTRVQALVVALLAWGIAVFAFDLVALGVMVSTKAATAAQDIDFVCDATHVNAAADLHSGYEDANDRPARRTASASAGGIDWLAVNPVDLFRALNLPRETGVHVSAADLFLGWSGWLAVTLGASLWRLRRADL